MQIDECHGSDRLNGPVIMAAISQCRNTEFSAEMKSEGKKLSGVIVHGHMTDVPAVGWDSMTNWEKAIQSSPDTMNRNIPSDKHHEATR